MKKVIKIHIKNKNTPLVLKIDDEDTLDQIAASFFKIISAGVWTLISTKEKVLILKPSQTDAITITSESDEETKFDLNNKTTNDTLEEYSVLSVTDKVDELEI